MGGGQLNLLSSVVLKTVIVIIMVIIQKKYFGYVFCPITVSKLMISVYFYITLRDNNCLSRKLKTSFFSCTNQHFNLFFPKDMGQLSLLKFALQSQGVEFILYTIFCSVYYNTDVVFHFRHLYWLNCVWLRMGDIHLKSDGASQPYRTVCNPFKRINLPLRYSLWQNSMFWKLLMDLGFINLLSIGRLHR